MMQFNLGICVVGVVMLGAVTASAALPSNQAVMAPIGSCPSASLQVCGQNYTAQAGSLGNVQTFSLPDIYKASSFAVQCVTDDRTAYYRVIGDNVNCDLKTCAPSSVTMCGVTIPVKEEIKLGDRIQESIPSEFLAPSYAAETPRVSALCHMVDGAAHYDLDDQQGLSCNAFLCQPLTLNICNSSVVITHTAELGAVFQEKTADNAPVTVQCLGSEGAPHYVITDNSCN